MVKNKRYNKNHVMWAYIMILPTIIGLLILNIIPFFQTIILSFQKTGSFGNNAFNGIDNYLKFVKDPVVWLATRNTLLYMILTVPLSIIIPVVIAALLNTNIKGKTIYRLVYFLPMVVAPAAIAMVWKWLFNADTGLINYVLSFIGINKIHWLTDPKFAIVSMAIVSIWSSIGYNIILILAGLQGISKSYYEACKIDGASGIRQFLSITIPLLSPTLFFVLIMQMMSSLKQFDLIYMLIGDTNPSLKNIQTLNYLFYKQAFVIGDKGYASVIVLWTFAIIGLVTIIQFKIQKKWVHYS